MGRGYFVSDACDVLLDESEGGFVCAFCERDGSTIILMASRSEKSQRMTLREVRLTARTLRDESCIVCGLPCLRSLDS